ncbi:MAG: COX15/CtaA family protein [Magnetococcales bacterium]|nr:COX15/CtaA family protein [Magnetococcales bacterium]
MNRRDQRWVGFWLFVCAALVYAMLALGGITRLTGSGLSMVEWQPGTFFPPSTQAAWEETFAKYQESPEFRHINPHMNLEGFKGIFWLEFYHRLTGRMIGFVFFLPFAWFLWRRMIDRDLARRLFGIFVLGGMQGVMGWLMVASGLIDNPHVSAYRLTAHLGLAFLIYGLLLWSAMDQFIGEEGRPTGQAPAAMPIVSLGVIGMICVTVVSGGFVAGAKAGYGYNTFPLMAGQWLPDAYWDLEPGWKNLFENNAAIQWNHRLMATLTLLSVWGYWSWGRRQEPPSKIRVGLDLLFLAAVVQVSLGIATLLMLVPIPLAWTHQVWSMMVFTIALFVHFHLRTGSARQGWN